MRGDLDFDFHTRVGEPGADHGRGRTDLTEAPAQHGPARLEILDAGKNVVDTNHFGERAAGFLQSPLDIAKALLGLLDDIVGDGHRLVVEAGGAGDENPLAVDNGPGVTDVPLQRRAG